MEGSAGHRSVYFFGVFGAGNLGNECTLQAILLNLPRYDSTSESRCICSHPTVAGADYKILCFPIRETPLPPAKNALARILRRLLVGIPTEIYRWYRAFRLLNRDDMLVMTGTGMLGDFGIRPLDLHYDILRWSMVAKLRRCRLLFVSVGAGPIRNWLSRVFVRAALSLADYRSYRDTFSYNYLKTIGFDAKNDAVRPDLAFSFPKDLIPKSEYRRAKRRVIGIGLMDYRNRLNIAGKENHYSKYIEQLTGLVTWLLERGFTVRLLIGDAVYDKHVGEDLISLLGVRGAKYDAEQIINEPAGSVGEVLSQLASSDLVVASRFHNVLLALMLAKPVLAISYHEKVQHLMRDMGMGDFCQDIENLDIKTLGNQILALEANAENIKRDLVKRAQTCRDQLDEQYSQIFGAALGHDLSVRKGEFCCQ